MKLNLSRIHYPATALGPGNRIGIWFQGCSIRCTGCISVDTWAFGAGETTVADLINAITPWLDDADGVTISGGEPFDQPEQLHAVLQQLREKLWGGDILVYSGYCFSAIEAKVRNMEGLIDALISEPYVRDEKQSLPLRGSDNQVLHTFTPLGEQRYRDLGNSLEQNKKTLDIMFDENNTVWLVGIPQRGDLQRLSELLQMQGIESFNTEDRTGKSV